MSEGSPPSFQGPLDSWEEPWNKMTYFWHNDPPEVAVPATTQPMYDARAEPAALWATPQVRWGSQALQAWDNPWNKINYIGLERPSPFMAQPLTPPMPFVGYTTTPAVIPDMWRIPLSAVTTLQTDEYVCKVIEVGSRREPPSPFVRVSDNSPCEVGGAVRLPPLRNIHAPPAGCPRCQRGPGASCAECQEATVVPRSFPKRLKGNTNRSERILKIKRSPNIIRFDKDYIRRWKEEAKKNRLQDMFCEIKEPHISRLKETGKPDSCRFCSGPVSTFGFCKNCSTFSAGDIRSCTLPTVQEVNETITETCIQAEIPLFTPDTKQGGDDGDKGTGNEGEESATTDGGDSNRMCLCYLTHPDSETGPVEHSTLEQSHLESQQPQTKCEGSNVSEEKSGGDDVSQRICLCDMDLPDVANERVLDVEPTIRLQEEQNVDNSKDEDKNIGVESEDSRRICLCDMETEVAQPIQISETTDQEEREAKNDDGEEGGKPSEEEKVRICLCIMEDWENENQPPPRALPPLSRMTQTRKKRRSKKHRHKETTDIALWVQPSDVTSEDAEIQTAPQVIQLSNPKPTQTDGLSVHTTQTQTEAKAKSCLPAPTQTDALPSESSQTQTENTTTNTTTTNTLGECRPCVEFTPNGSPATPFGAAMNVGNASPNDITVVLYSNRVMVAEVVQRKIYCESILSQTWELPEDVDETSIRCFLGKGILLLLTIPPPSSFVWPFSSPLVCLGTPRPTVRPCKIPL